MDKKHFTRQIFNEKKALSGTRDGIVSRFAVYYDPELKEMISKSVEKQQTLAGFLFGVSDDEANAISVLLNNGWTIQLDSKFDCFGLKRKGF